MLFQSYISSDPVGQIQRGHRSGYGSVFNLTRSSISYLVSTMMVTVNTNSSMMISTATVTCGQQPSEQAVLHTTTIHLLDMKLVNFSRLPLTVELK